MQKKILILISSIIIIVASFGFFNGIGDPRDDLLKSGGSFATSKIDPVLLGDTPGMTTGANNPNYSYMGSGAGYTNFTNDTAWFFQFGGDNTGGGTITNVMTRYNVITNTWTTMAPMPAPNWYAAGANVNAFIFNFGGLGLSLPAVQFTAVKYSIASNTWSFIANMPGARAMARACGYQDSLVYIAGGMDATDIALNNVWLYNRLSDSYRVCTPMPAPRRGGAFAISGDTLVYVCGADGMFGAGTVQSTVFRGIVNQADRSVINWTTPGNGLNYPPGGRYRIDGGRWGCKGIVVSGGGTADSYAGATANCYVYSPGANVWTAEPSLITSRLAHMTGSVRFNNANIWKFVNSDGYNGTNVMTNDILTDTLCPVVLAYLCEQFTATVFPPTGWTNDNATYCYRASVSGFGVGSGSAVFDFWNAPVGNIQNLTTLVFYPSLPGDSLYVDMAYNTAVYTGDSLIISTSTNGGTNFTSLVRLSGSSLSTTTTGNDPFTPTPSQWAKRKYLLPIGTNKINFMGKSNFGDNLYIDSVCTHSLEGIIHNQNSIPANYSLSQNYPNPFNPTTVISFALSKSGNVKLVVYDILGREVKTLVNEYRAAGNYNIVFDASSLASGVYFYKLQAGDYIATKKMLMIK